MIVRIVKLTFEPSKTEAFEELFQRNKERIRGFDGCKFLELYRDKNNNNIFFTYSYWKDEEALENYRISSFFQEVWSQTKQLFAAKPEAWSVDKLWSSNSVNSAQ